MEFNEIIIFGDDREKGGNCSKNVIAVSLTDEEREHLLDIAEKKKANLLENKSCKERSVLDGSGTVWGTIGEYVFVNYLNSNGLKASFPEAISIDYDVNFNDLKWEVKSKKCKSTPCPNYECSTPNYYEQKCDYYVFVRVRDDWMKAWIMGYKKREDFKRDSVLHEKNTERGSNNVFYASESNILSYYDCDPITDLIKEKE